MEVELIKANDPFDGSARRKIERLRVAAVVPAAGSRQFENESRRSQMYLTAGAVFVYNTIELRKRCL